MLILYLQLIKICKNNNAYSNSYHRVSATPPPVNKLLTSSGGISGNLQKAPRIGPGGRRMVKSFSQDAASSMASAATIAMNTLSSGIPLEPRSLCETLEKLHVFMLSHRNNSCPTSLLERKNSGVLAKKFFTGRD